MDPSNRNPVSRSVGSSTYLFIPMLLNGLILLAALGGLVYTRPSREQTTPIPQTPI